jgi:hypothetical protein
MTNPKACYSNLQSYGLTPSYRPIQPPIPSSVMLALFETNKPHDIIKPDLIPDNRAYKCSKKASSCQNVYNSYSY